LAAWGDPPTCEIPDGAGGGETGGGVGGGTGTGGGVGVGGGVGGVGGTKEELVSDMVYSIQYTIL